MHRVERYSFSCSIHPLNLCPRPRLIRRKIGGSQSAQDSLFSSLSYNPPLQPSSLSPVRTVSVENSLLEVHRHCFGILSLGLGTHFSTTCDDRSEIVAFLQAMRRKIRYGSSRRRSHRSSGDPGRQAQGQATPVSGSVCCCAGSASVEATVSGRAGASLMCSHTPCQVSWQH